MVKRWRRATGAGSWAFVVSKRASCLEPRALSLVSSIFKRVAAGPNCATVGGNRTSNGPKDDGWSFGRTGRTVTQFRRGGCRPKSPPTGALRRLYQIRQFCHREGRSTEATWNQNTSATLNNAQREITEQSFLPGAILSFVRISFSSLMSLISALGRNSQFTQRKARLYLGLLSSGQPGALWEVWRSGGEEVAPGNGGRELGFCCVQTGFVPRASSTLSRFLHFQTSKVGRLKRPGTKTPQRL